MVVYCPYAAREHMGLAACSSPEPGKGTGCDNLCRGTYQDRTQRENGKQSFHNLHG